MKIKVIGISVLALLAVGLTGCGHHQTKSADKASSRQSVVKKQAATKAGASSTKKETPKPSALTTLLNGLTQKNAEDRSTQSNGELTYSQFYYQKGNWHWQVTSQNRGTIASGTVDSIQSSQDGDYKLAMKSPKGEAYTLELTYTNKSADYTVKTSYQHIKGVYIIGDTTGVWKTGAPSELVGTWSTGFAPSTRTDDKKIAYDRTRFFISDQSIDGQIDSFTKNYTVYQTGNGWGANNAVYYQSLGQGTYLLKTYSDKYLGSVYRVILSGNRLTVPEDGMEMKDMTKVANKPGMAFGFGNNPAKQLTEKQLDDWITRHLSDFGGTTHTYKQSGISTPEKDSKGRVVVTVRDMGRDDIAPTIGRFRVSSTGVLEWEDTSDGADIWSPVSDDPTN